MNPLLIIDNSIYERNKMEVKEKSSWEEEVKEMTPEERLSFLHFVGRELTKNPPKTLEEKETERRVRLVFEKWDWDF
jgi:hypothetical protein